MTIDNSDALQMKPQSKLKVVNWYRNLTLKQTWDVNTLAVVLVITAVNTTILLYLGEVA